jgi:hypothetical protein
MSFDGWIFSKTTRRRAEEGMIKEAIEKPQLTGVISASELLFAQIYPARLFAKSHIEKRLNQGWIIINDNVRNARVRSLWKRLGKLGFELVVVEQSRGYLGFCLFNKMLRGHELGLASLDSFKKILMIRFLGWHDDMLILFYNGNMEEGIRKITSNIMKI